MLINRSKCIERLQAGEKLHGEGNTMVFKNGDFITAATDIYLRDKVKITGTISRPIYTWNRLIEETGK